MILLPIIERELRVAARSRQTYRNRFLAALAICGVLLWAFSNSRRESQDLIGRQMFDYLTTTALLLALCAGLFQTADAISDERRAGTLGLLYLTDLRSSHVIAGKLFALSIPAVFALATVIPALAIPFIMGGILPGELIRAVLVLANGLWLSLAAGLLASCLARDDRGTFLLTTCLTALPSLLAIFGRVENFGVFWSLNHASDLFYRSVQVRFWTGMLAQLFIPFLYLTVAARRARRLWRENPLTAAGEKRREIWRVWSTGARVERSQWRSQLLDENPAVWLACRHRVRVAALWGMLGCMAIFLTWLYYDEKRLEPLAVSAASVIAHWMLKIALAFAAARSLTEEARSGAFELLFTTQLGPVQLVKGYMLGMLRSYGPPVCSVILLETLWISTANEVGMTPSLMVMRMIFLALDTVAISIFALAHGLRSRRSGRTAIVTLVWVVVLPNLGMLFLVGPQLELYKLIPLWLGFDIGLVAWAVRRLGNLREQVSERFSSSSAPG